MTTNDVRDMLNLPVDGARPAKKQRTAAPRPNLKGLAREVQNLGGDNPIAIVPEISSFKRRRFGSRKPAAKWELRSFHNSARGDSTLILRHWMRKPEEAPIMQSDQQPDGPDGDTAMGDEKKPEEIEDSSFAKFNVQVDVPQYSEDQYKASLANDSWTKDETDYLMELVKDFDLRWPLIWDRYDYQPKPPPSSSEGDTPATDPNTAVVPAAKTRSVEDLKARYYEVAAKMMAVQKPVQYMNQAEFSLHEIMANFNPADEVRRKKFAEAQLSRSKEEAREEESLLIEVRRILARSEKFNQERRELYDRLDYPHADSTQDLSVFKTSGGLQNLLQNLMTVDKSKKRKSIMGSDGANTPASAGHSAHPGSTPASDHHRRDSIAASSAGGHGHRDSISGHHDRSAKKGPQPLERRKLTDQEQQIYGVSYHDRLPSGPTFRYERINKILTTKSNAQHQRIINTLTELDVPARLNMPTAAVVKEMETLLVSIQNLLDLRKLNDKLDGEIKLEQAKKAEREKLNPPPPEVKAKGAPATDSNEAKAEGKKSDTETAPPAAATPAQNKETNGEQTNGDAPSVNGEKVAEKSEATKSAESAKAVPKVKQEAAEDKATSRPGSAAGRPRSSSGRPGSSRGRPGSSDGRHKRSASVLSTVSDKSTKRQRK